MIVISEEALNRVADVGRQLIEAAELLRLGSIAKAIEQQEGCQIFIVPFDSRVHSKSRCCVATCESYIALGAASASAKEPKMTPINHHFVFYKPHPKNIEVEKSRIAHGLAHCALHWPLGPRKKRLVRGKLHGVDVYLVKFLPEEEEEADALACLFTACRPAL
jgi:hypothetical protein